MAHSPFPWRIHPSDRTAVFDADGLKVAACTSSHTFRTIRETAEDNAALIASIPDMVKALEEIADLVDSEAGEPLDDAISIANKALAACRSKS